MKKKHRLQFFISAFQTEHIDSKFESILLNEHSQSTQSAFVWGDVEFDHVSFTYPTRDETPILHDLSLIARTGKITGVTGPSGCGKFF